MRTAFLIAFFACITVSVFAQQKLSDHDLNNLIILSQLYSKDNMFKQEATQKQAETLRSPVLNHVIDGLVATGKADTSVISKKFLQRPANEELKLWYVIEKVHYNRIDTVKGHRPAIEVAKEVLEKEIDERVLLNNYYSMTLGSGLAFLFNQADLSQYNLDLESYGLKDPTEKAILYFRLIDPMTRGRFLVLNHMKNYERLSAVIKRLPLINGKAYYYYTDFNFADFDNDNLYKKESFKHFNINFLMQSELIHFNLYAISNKKDEGRNLYQNSILSKPEYFEFTDGKDMLQKFYDESKKWNVSFGQ